MKKTKTVILLTILLSTMFIAFFPFTPASKASTGTVLIGVTTLPAPIVSVHSGGNISVYFGSVTFSGSQFYLMWSADGFSSISLGDFKFSPIFSTIDLHVSRKLSNGIYVGNNWVNISIPTAVVGGHYYVKCFDGSATSVAVSNNYVNVLPILEVTPFTRGAGGSPISLEGTAFTANSAAKLTYYDPIAAANKTLATVSTDEHGHFTYATTSLDLKQWMPAGENPITFDVIKFFSNDTSTGYQAEADYREGRRGLLQVGNVYPLPGDMFGNNTGFATIQVHVNDYVRIAGNYFHPPAVTIYFDNATMGTAQTNSSGFFNTTVRVPITSIGTHRITLKDAVNQTTTTTTSTTTTTVLTTTTTTTSTTTTTTTKTITTTIPTTTTATVTTTTTTTATSPLTTTKPTSTTTSQTSTSTTSTTSTTTSTYNTTSTPSTTTSSTSTTSTTTPSGPESNLLIPAVLVIFIAIVSAAAILLLRSRRK